MVIPAWNEAAVLTMSIERLVGLDYPPERLRGYVVDDASTDTPAVLATCAERFPGRIVHPRRDKGGQGKAHTRDHGVTRSWPTTGWRRS